MMIDFDACSKLEDIHFKYERICSLLSCLQSVIAEVAEVHGLPENAIEYSLYELETEMDKNNKMFCDIISRARYIKEGAAS